MNLLSSFPGPDTRQGVEKSPRKLNYLHKLAELAAEAFAQP
jgi:hypothetical protein